MSKSTDKPDADRHNGMLTTKNREFLKSDGSGYNHQDKNYHKTQIVQRVRNTILDFTLLFECWKEHDLDGREQVFQEAFRDDDLFNGLTSFIALLYMDNPYGLDSGLQTLLFQGVTKAERELSESDLYFPTKVDFSVEHVGTAEFEKAIQKFRRGKLSDMTDGEAQAIVRMLDRSGTVTSDDLEEMRQDIVDQIDEITNEHNEAIAERAKNAREKQARQQSNDE